MSEAPAADDRNQPPPFADVNLFRADRPLRDALAAHGVPDADGALAAHGAAWGAAERLDLGRLANENPPKLRTHDARGERADRVEFHPAYDALMAASMADALHERGGAAERAARLLMTEGVEAGHVCPMVMTHAAGAALSADPELLAAWRPRLEGRRYDPRFRPFWEKEAVTLGMGMTERQGGTDVRANTTRAVRTGGTEYALTGHKWFLSAPMSDAFLVLAQAEAGLTCFLLPRFRPDGSVNALHLQRLKDKLGNRANASAEAEFSEAFAWRVGEEGRGIATILAMVQLTRLDCAVASAGLVRMALAVAIHHARHRRVFGRAVLAQPAMRAVLADLALESEALTALGIATAALFDAPPGDTLAAAGARLLTPAAKFLACKLAPGLIVEAMECLGGNGYVEESPLPRLYREAPVNAIWEGSGTIMALDVRRAASRDPEGAAAVLARLSDEARGLPGVPAAVEAIRVTLGGADAEARVRAATERLATLAAVAALARSAPPVVAEAYARTRLAAHRGALAGCADLAAETDLLLARAVAEK